MARVLIYCVALNGLDRMYAQAIRSHRQYARNHGFSYLLVREPNEPTHPHLAAWLKASLMSCLFKQAWDWLVCLDADALVRPHTPAVTALEEPGCDLYLAHGASDRVNTGVMIARNSQRCCQFFHAVLKAAPCTPPPQHDVGWGENGHVIWLSQNQPWLKILDKRWNNTSDPHLADFIRHYTGPMRCHERPTLRERLARAKRSRDCPIPASLQLNLLEQVASLTRRCMALNTIWTHPSQQEPHHVHL